MKKIILIGDSIRMGYDKYVAKALGGQAQVYYPGENCRFTQYVLRNFSDWVRQSGFGKDTDLVHWNVGLWDVICMFDDEEITPIEVYEHYLHRICKRIIRFCPNAKVVFATSTPIDQEAYAPDLHRFWRSNETIRRYNEVAVRVVQQYGFAVNDLFALMEDVPKHFYSDKTHFYTKDATERMTNRVLDVIAEQIGVTGQQLDYSTFFGASSDDIGM